MINSYMVLILLYTFTAYFIQHQKSHLAFLGADRRVQLNPLLSTLMAVEGIAGLLFLVWYGYKTVWYYPMILVLIGIPTTFVLKIVEHAVKLHRIAWAISITGIVVVPILLYLMVLHINAVVD